VTCDAFHRVRPDPDMHESVRAMHLAVQDAGLATDEIEVLHYHGTGTQLNDALESQAVQLAFGDHARRLRGYSIKGAIGHPQGACGMAAVVATLAALTAQDELAPKSAPASPVAGPFHPPTINLRETDPACALDYTPRQAAPADARTALINCLAFGAKNSALVVRAER
jgi:3-oxoacyl-[acyl-carrier-protein] synthase II